MAADPAQRSDQTVADDPNGRGFVQDRRGCIQDSRGFIRDGRGFIQDRRGLLSGGSGGDSGGSLGDSLGTARRHRVSAASLCAADGRATGAVSAARGLYVCAGEAGGAECEHGSDEAVEQRREGGGAPSVAQVNVV